MQHIINSRPQVLIVNSFLTEQKPKVLFDKYINSNEVMQLTVTYLTALVSL